MSSAPDNTTPPAINAGKWDPANDTVRASAPVISIGESKW
jgi:hypothetical protein